MRPTQARSIARQRPDLKGRISDEGGSLVVRGKTSVWIERFRLKTRRKFARLALALVPIR